MSNRRKPGRQPWKPWTAPERPARHRVKFTEQDNGRVRIDAIGADAGTMACIEAFRRGGATRIAFGWSAPGIEPAEDAPPGVEVTWWFEVTIGGQVQRGESKPTTDHARGILEAAAVILRNGGGTYTEHRADAN